jgi:ribosome biogenesis GTPase A
MIKHHRRFFCSVSRNKAFLQEVPSQRTLDHLDRLGLGYVPLKKTRKNVAIKYRRIGIGKGPGQGYAFLDEQAEHPFPFDRGAKQVKMINVANSVEEMPNHEPAPEVALIGRSNVGKSTLLNAVMGFKSHLIEAKVSDKPGETKSLHFYAMGKPKHRGPPALVVVDMPGYGFAFMDEEQQRKLFELVCRLFM